MKPTAWYFENELIGYISQYPEGLIYVRLLDAGHEALRYKPAPILRMFQDFVRISSSSSSSTPSPSTSSISLKNSNNNNNNNNNNYKNFLSTQSLNSNSNVPRLFLIELVEQFVHIIMNNILIY